QSMCKVRDFLIVLKCKLLGIQRSYWDTEEYDSYKRWFTDGYEAEVLDVGGEGWKKGRVKINISIEFIPDHPEEFSQESPLDDIRQSISNN
ncbi:MAG: KGK domain-containing protein, partial [Limnothrix sp.]